jgi:hypothetical protein
MSTPYRQGNARPLRSEVNTPPNLREARPISRMPLNVSLGALAARRSAPKCGCRWVRSGGAAQERFPKASSTRSKWSSSINDSVRPTKKRNAICSDTSRNTTTRIEYTRPRLPLARARRTQTRPSKQEKIKPSLVKSAIRPDPNSGTANPKQLEVINYFSVVH